MTKQELYAKQYTIAKSKLDEGWKDIVNYGQLAADVATIPMSFFPGLNLVASAIQAGSAAIDVAQGETEDAAWRAGAAALGLIPGGGAVATGGKLAKGAIAASKAVKAADVAADVAKVAKGVDVAADVAKASKAVKAADAATDALQAGKQVSPKLLPTTAGEQIVSRNAANAVAKTAQTKVPATATTTIVKAAESPTINVTGRKVVQNTAPRAARRSPSGPAGVGARTTVRQGKVAKAGRIANAARAMGRAATAGKVLAGAAVAGGVVGAVASRVADKIADEITNKDKTPDNKVIPPEPDVRRAGLDVGQLGAFGPGEIGLSSKSVGRDDTGRASGNNERWHHNPWLLSPRLSSISRSATVDSRGRVSEEMDHSTLSTKVKNAVNNYLKSKHGKELNNHLNNITNMLKSN